MGADANFWIRKRDLDIAHLLAKAKNETGYPHTFRVGFTKNSTKKSLIIDPKCKIKKIKQ